MTKINKLEDFVFVGDRALIAFELSCIAVIGEESEDGDGKDGVYSVSMPNIPFHIDFLSLSDACKLFHQCVALANAGGTVEALHAMLNASSVKNDLSNTLAMEPSKVQRAPLVENYRLNRPGIRFAFLKD